MTLRSAYQDFVERTLAGLAGSWQRLTYLGSLADGKGNYSHWGMTKTFGPLQASEALAQAHTDSWLGVLRAPLPLLMGELQLADSLFASRDERRLADRARLLGERPE